MQKSEKTGRAPPPEDEVPPLDRWRADGVLEPARPIWGLPAIAKVLGLSINATRKLAKLPGVPIYLPAGCSQYFAWRSELVAWLRGQSDPRSGTDVEG